MEAFLLILHWGFALVAGFVRREQSIEEVLRFGVFFQTTHQVRHGNVEVFHVHNWGVQDLATDDVVDSLGLCWGHASQHLGIDLAGYATLLG